MQNYIGQGSHQLGARALIKVSKNGLFEATINSLPGMQFSPNIVCIVSFRPDYPPQPMSVLRVVGRHGERLGFPSNPQATWGSGGWISLETDVHVN